MLIYNACLFQQKSFFGFLQYFSHMQPADLNSQLAIAGTNIILYIYLKEYKDIYIYKDLSEKNGL